MDKIENMDAAAAELAVHPNDLEIPDQLFMDDERLLEENANRRSHVEEGVSAEISVAGMSVKRKYTAIDPDVLYNAKRSLFDDELEPPTETTFYVEGDRIDLNDPSACTLQRMLFARIYNGLVNISKSKLNEDITDASLKHTLTQQLHRTRIRLNAIYKEGLKGQKLYLNISKAINFVLRGMEHLNSFNVLHTFSQLDPITCFLDEKTKTGLKVDRLELRKVNNSSSLVVELNYNLKFIYAGQIQSKTIQNQGEKYYIVPTSCMGNYLDELVSRLYDIIYDRTVQKIQWYMNKYPDDPAPTAPTDIFSEMDSSRNVYKTLKVAPAGQEEDRQIIDYLVQSVGREVDLKKVNLERMNVFVLTSAMYKKPNYLYAKGDDKCRLDSKILKDTDAVFLSSYVRARVMQDGTLSLQIFSRTCMYISDDPNFPPTIEGA